MVKKAGNIIIRIIATLVIFIVAVFTMSKMINRETPQTTQAMADATLPLLYMLNEDVQLNSLHGYVAEMDVKAMHDNLTPLDSDRSVKIQIQPFETKISDITFKVITADGNQVMENTKASDITEDENYVNATLQLQSKILINTEYMLEIKVTVGSRDVYYYARIIQKDGLRTQSYLNFVMGFFERCLEKTELDVIGECVEPDGTGDGSDNDTIVPKMDIHNTVEQLSWGSLKPTIYVKPIPSIQELNETTATICLDYVISVARDSDITDYYHVTEYYRMRYTDTRVMLLDFERSTSQIFNPEHGEVLTSNGINLGLTSMDVTYKNDSENNFFAFVQEGALWMYEVASGQFSQVFSFPQQENSSARDTYGKNNIQIIDVDTGGDMYFLVCGYMNRGRHEGESGVAVYYYDSQVSSTEECLFVDTDQTYSLMRQDMESLSYVTEDRDAFYLMLDNNVYCVDMETRKLEQVISNVGIGCHASSKSGKYFAWVEDGIYNSTTIKVMDLDNRKITEVSCKKKQRIRPLGYMDENLIYGIAKASDVDTSHKGNELFPMRRIEIINTQGEVIKEYGPDGVYITDAVVQDKLTTLSRVRKNGNVYEEIEEDHIVNSVADESTSYGLTNQLTNNVRETVLQVASALTVKSVSQVIRCQQIAVDGSTNVVIDTQGETEDVYYVYAKGELDSIHTAANEAIKRADEALGVVVESATQQYVWERGNKVTKLNLDITTYPSAINEGIMDPKQLGESLGKTVLDLSGCTLDQVLYFVSAGLPVLAQTADGPVIISGYDEYNTILLKPGESETYFYGMQDSTKLFEESGNVFVTYLDPVTAD